MSNWTFSDLKKWDEKVCALAEKMGLDWFPINYEVCDYYEMIGHMSYHGMPSHYQHWSYGKSFERTHQMYNLGAEGLPYELIINSNPSIAYLMKENPLYLQILIMAHCVGHSDFFKNNRLFSSTSPDSVVFRFRNARKRIQSYVENPNIGLKKVEKFLDSLHAIRFQTERNLLRRKAKKEIKKKYIDLINNDVSNKYKNFNLNKPLLEPDGDLLSFLVEYGTHFEDWQIDILNIVKDESKYFIPQINTKILNEGWASFWHYKLCHELDLPQEYHLPFLKSHNQVIRPHIGKINPYHLGFHIFKKIEKEKGIDECFFIRSTHDDAAALRSCLDIDDYRELNLFSYSTKKENISIDEISDEKGWKEVRQDLLFNTGLNSMPSVIVSDITRSGDLILKHLHDGRDLDLEYAERVVEKVQLLWPKDVKFFTIIEEESWEI
jgi:stage V sporulation protein R